MDGQLRALVGLVWLVGCTSAGLVPAASDTPLRRADAIVVLGNRPPVDREGRIRDELRRRMDRGIALYREGLAPRLVLTGGPDGRGHIEAEVMEAYARAAGVPAEAILTETRSTSTIENAGYGVPLLCEALGQPCYPRILLVSTPHHLGRAEEVFACAGAEVQAAAAAMPGEEGSDERASYVRAAIVRERLVRFHYGGIDVCEHVRAAMERAALGWSEGRTLRGDGT